MFRIRILGELPANLQGNDQTRASASARRHFSLDEGETSENAVFRRPPWAPAQVSWNSEHINPMSQGTDHGRRCRCWRDLARSRYGGDSGETRISLPRCPSAEDAQSSVKADDPSVIIIARVHGGGCTFLAGLLPVGEPDG
jgi:hypothetical protein